MSRWKRAGMILRVLMNADLDQAVGFLSPPQQRDRVQTNPRLRPGRERRTLALALSHGAADRGRTGSQNLA